MFTNFLVSGDSRKYRMMQSKWRKSWDRPKGVKLVSRRTKKGNSEELSSLVAFSALDFKVQANV